MAEEVYQYDISVMALSPSQLVVTPGTLYFKMAAGLNDPRAEPPEMMAKAALLLATEPLDKINGRVTYSQAILMVGRNKSQNCCVTLICFKHIAVVIIEVAQTSKLSTK